MKKGILITTLNIILLVTFIFPSNVFADEEMTNLKEAVEEEISTFEGQEGYDVDKLKSYDLSNYKDSNQKVNVYIFRGNTCGHCFEAIEYFAGIYKDYGKYMNVKTYEVWNNKDNNSIMEKVAKEVGDEASGVPYIVIGDKSWSGYAESYNKEIEAKIKSEYKKAKEDRTDLVKIVNGEAKAKNNTGKDIVSLIVILVVGAGIVFGIIKARNSSSK